MRAGVEGPVAITFSKGERRGPAYNTELDRTSVTGPSWEDSESKGRPMSHVDSCLRLHIRPWGRGRQLLVDFIKTKQENIAVVSQFPSPRTENSERTQKCGPGGHAGGDTPPPKGRPDSVLASRPVQHKTSWSAGCCWCRGTAGTCPRPPRGPGRALAAPRGAGVTPC